jgi:O-antigen/teichoic acid export membrane protein
LLATQKTEERLDEGAGAAAGASASPHAFAHLPVGRSIARGALALLTVQPLSWAASLLSAIVIPRLLGSDVLGQLVIATTITGIVSTVTGLGISEFLVRRAAQRPHTLRRDQGIALMVQMIAAALGFAAVALGGWLFATSMVDYRLLLVASLTMFVAPAQTVLLSSLRGTERHQDYAWFCAASGVLVALGGVLVLLVGGDAIAFLAFTAAVFTMTTLAAWRLSGLRPGLPSLSKQVLSASWEFIRAGFPFVSWQVTQLVYSQIDRLLLGLLVPAFEVGWYAAANRIIAIPIFIPTLIITPLFPALSRSAHQPELLRRTLVQTVRFMLLLTVPLSAGTIVVAPLIPSLLGWPADFANAALPMSILALQLPLVAVGMVLGTVLMAIGREKRLVVVSIIATSFNIVANLLAIPASENLMGNGGIGAAGVTVASEILMLIGALVFVPKHLLDMRIVWDALRIMIAGAATAVVGVALLPVALFVCVPAGAATYVAVVALLRVLTIEDVRLVTTRLRNR